MPYTPEQLQQILDLVNSGGQVPAAPEAPAQPQEEYPYDVYQRQFEETQRRRSAGKRYIAQQMLANPKQQEAIEKALRGILDTDVPEMKPFEERDNAKYIMSELPRFRQKDDMIRTVRLELEDASKAKDAKEKAARIRTIVPKLVQSIGTGGADALQPAEFILGSPEMTNYFNYTKDKNLNPVSPASLAAFLSDPAIGASQFLEADPDSYIKKIKGIYNNFAKARDEKINDFALMSSPSWVRKTTGLRPMDRFKDAEEPSFGQVITPFGTSPGLTVTSGAGQMIAPTQQPVTSGTQQMQAPAGRGSTLYRIVPRK